MNRMVYADYAATTRVSDAAAAAMTEYLTEEYGNPSSLHTPGQRARVAVEDARRKMAKAIGADPKEIYFTSGASEADNWAIKGVAFVQAKKGKKHLISSAYEHHAVLEVMEALEKEGFEVTYLKPSTEGLIDPADVEAAIRPDTGLVSIMYANNEIGTINPIAAIGEICTNHQVLFHTDAVQAFGHVAIDVKAQHIDMMSLSGHKFHSPKGVGCLYIKKGVALRNLIYGGAQEQSKRAGTENVPGIVAMSIAAEEAVTDLEANNMALTAKRDRLIDGLTQIERSHLNGSAIHRLSGNINITFEGVEGESLLLLLDARGICASSGSACTSQSLEPSHVLLAIGLPHEVAHGSLRLSIGRYTTDEDIDYILQNVPPVIERLRAMSPLWDKIKNR